MKSTTRNRNRRPKCKLDHAKVVATEGIACGEPVCLYYGEVVDTPLDTLDWAVAVRSMPFPDDKRVLIPTERGLLENKVCIGHFIQDAGYVAEDVEVYERMSIEVANCTVFLEGKLRPYSTSPTNEGPSCYQVYATRDIRVGEVLYTHRGLGWWTDTRGRYIGDNKKGGRRPNVATGPTGTLTNVNMDVLAIVIGHMADIRLAEIRSDPGLSSVVIPTPIRSRVWYYNLCNMAQVDVSYDASCDYAALWRAFVCPLPRATIPTDRVTGAVVPFSIEFFHGSRLAHILDTMRLGDGGWHPGVIDMLAAIIRSERETCRYRPGGLGASMEGRGSLIYLDPVARSKDAIGVWGIGVMSAILSRGCVPLLEVMLGLDYNELDRTWNAKIPYDVIHSLIDSVTDTAERKKLNKGYIIPTGVRAALWQYWDQLGGVVRDHIAAEGMITTEWETWGLCNRDMDAVREVRSVAAYRGLLNDILADIGLNAALGRTYSVKRRACHVERSLYLHRTAPGGDDTITLRGKYDGATFDSLYQNNNAYIGWYDYNVGPSECGALFTSWCDEWCHRSGVKPLRYQPDAERIDQKLAPLDRKVWPMPLSAVSSYITIATQVVGSLPSHATLSEMSSPYSELSRDNPPAILEITWEVAVNGRLERSAGYILQTAMEGRKRLGNGTSPRELITVDDIARYGVGWHKIIPLLREALGMVTHIVIHDAHFGMRMIAAELLRCGAVGSRELVRIITSMPVIDTLYSNQEPGKKGYKVALWKLCDQVVGMGPELGGRPLSDVRVTRKCYEALVGLPSAIE